MSGLKQNSFFISYIKNLFLSAAIFHIGAIQAIHCVLCLKDLNSMKQNGTLTNRTQLKDDVKTVKNISPK